MTPQSAIATLPGAPIVDTGADWQPTTLAGHLATDLVQSTLDGRVFRVRVLRVALRLALRLRTVFA